MEPQKEKKWETISGIPLKEIYTPEDINDTDYDRDIGMPGQGPFVRGAYPHMYRSRPWRISQLMGSGSLDDVKDRVQKLRKEGEDRIMFEADEVTSGLELDDPEVMCRIDDVGLSGAPRLGLVDTEKLYEGIDLANAYVFCGPSPYGACQILSAADKQGVSWDKLRGSGHSPFFLPYLSSSYDNRIPPRAQMRLCGDCIEFLVKHCPHVTPVSIEGYNFRANGFKAWEEIGAVFALAQDYIEELLKRPGIEIDHIAHALGGINMASGMDFFEEICKMRAARRVWYKLMKDKYGAQNPRSWQLRIHTVTCGDDYTYQQPLNNITRTAVHSLAAALAGVQGQQTASYDEAICAPSEEAALVALRTQQIIMLESGVTKVTDPLGGSYYVEWLTNEVETRAWEYLHTLEEKGGWIGAAESGWLHKEALKGMLDRERKVNSGELPLVGVNCFQMEEEPFSIPAHEHDANVWEKVMQRLEKLRQERDDQRLNQAMDDLRQVCLSGDNIMPAMLEAVKAYMTPGEWGNLSREIFGTYKVPMPL